MLARKKSQHPQLYKCAVLHPYIVLIATVFYTILCSSKRFTNHKHHNCQATNFFYRTDCNIVNCLILVLYNLLLFYCSVN